MSELKAPTGSEIQGTAESILGTASVVFDPSEPAGYDHDGNGTKMFWDTSTTKTIVSVPMFTDRDGTDWLQHHLIPADAEPLTDETILAFGNEERVGALLDQLQLTQKASEAAGVSMLLTRNAIADTQKIHARLKERSLALKARDLARVPA